MFSNMSQDLRDRVAGSFYGLLVGDALGCPVEGYTPEEIRDEYGRITEMMEPRRGWRPLGLHSDDGQQAIGLCDAVLESPGHPGPVFARLVVDMFRLGPAYLGGFGLHRGTGGNFQQTVEALARGVGWDQAPLLTAGNGAAMRIAPIALYHGNDPEALLEAVLDVSRVTHADTRGLAAAAAVALLVARALDHSGPARDLGDRELLESVYRMEDLAVETFGILAHQRNFSSGLDVVLASLDQATEHVLRQIEIIASRNAGFMMPPTHGFALASVLTAIYMFLSSRSFESALIDTISLGGDTDTTGAMVGQMCGALYGESAIPERWRRSLVAYGALEDRVDALVNRDAGYQPAVSLVELEGPWTEMMLKGQEP
jgi:ADP-ribosyl-[dinitrogen reductase] hydrolase